VTLRDTAGIRPTIDAVEQEGVRRAEHWATASDLILWVLDASDVDATSVEAAASGLEVYQRPGWLVLNKSDLISAPEVKQNEYKFISLGVPHFFISAADGRGVDTLVAAISRFATESFGGEPGLVTRERHRQMLVAATESLAEAMNLAKGPGVVGREELIAEQVRLATRALERLLGRVDVEDVLDVIFRDFCIGK